jgi:hypothetical protein
MSLLRSPGSRSTLPYFLLLLVLTPVVMIQTFSLKMEKFENETYSSNLVSGESEVSDYESKHLVGHHPGALGN